MPSPRCCTSTTAARTASGSPTKYGGRENLDAIDLLKEFNEQVHLQHPGVLTIAEESTAWPGVSRPTYLGGLGFSLKWNMGWMNDTLRYMRHEPIHRRYHHDELTFSLIYAFTENFVLPFSHDEVVHGKGSMLDQMPGGMTSGSSSPTCGCCYALQVDAPRQEAALHGRRVRPVARVELRREPRSGTCCSGTSHQGVQKLVADLNAHVRARAGAARDRLRLHRLRVDRLPQLGRQHRWRTSRQSKNPDDFLVVVCNFTPVAALQLSHRRARSGGWYQEILQFRLGVSTAARTSATTPA